MNLRVGLTGGIGSGKTQVSNELEKLGIDIIDTDDIAREIVKPGSPTIIKIAEHFGQQALTDTGALNRNWMRKHVFEHAEARAELERITHPVIADITEQRLRESSSAYCVAVIPLLFESEFTHLIDHTIVVVAPEEERIARVMRRSQLSRADVLKMMTAQMSDAERTARADTVIRNDGSLDKLGKVTRELHVQLLRLAAGN
jgi:dephospho-CoA kinase